jgi:hypothetical protein
LFYGCLQKTQDLGKKEVALLFLKEEQALPKPIGQYRGALSNEAFFPPSNNN